MTPIDQTIVCVGTGDCQRAVVASLFDLDIDQVPNFRKFPERGWFDVYWYFLYAMGYEYAGCLTPNKDRLELADSIDGYFEACVASKTFENATHAIIIDQNGVVIHDPNPNKLWQGINVLESGELKYWYAIRKRQPK